VGDVRLFYFGLLNFGLFAVGLRRLLRHPARQFFFSRRSRIRKELLESVTRLRAGREALDQAQRARQALPEEIERRRHSIASRCHEECDAILEEAKRRAAHLAEEAERCMHDDRARAVRALHDRLFGQAFVQAEKALAAPAMADARARLTDAGLRELAATSMLVPQEGGDA
jgi:F0F1-type ATP synthase membrane subunit b/b'